MSMVLFLVALGVIATACCRFASTSGPARGNTHPFSIHDMLAAKRVGNPQASPDGAWVLFEQRVTDLDKNKGITDLWLVRADGTGMRRLTTHPAGSTAGAWSPDGKSVYFLSARSESMQVWRIAVDGGEAEQVTDEPLDVGNLVLSPDGGHIAFSMEVFPGTTPSETKEQIDQHGEAKVTGQIHERLFIRHWDTWKDGTRSHLFVKPIGTGSAVDIMKAMEADAPCKPFGGPEEVTFTPDGKALVFTLADTGKQEAWSTQHNLFQAPLDASSGPRCITNGNRAWITNPVFSPDGKTLAYLAMSRPGFEADRFRIVLMDWPNGKPRVLTEAWDRSPGGITFAPDGRTIYTTADNVGQRSLFAIDTATGDAREVVREGKALAPVLAGVRVVFSMCHHKSPAELYTVNPDGSDLKPITGVNAELLASVRMGDSEQFSFTGANDDEVWAFAVKPVDFDPGKKYPVAFLIHGGPQGSFGNDFHYRWNPQAYAGAGYAVVMVDFHGSTGYGQAFTDSISGDWGGKPFIDLQKGLSAALERYPWMDGDRVAALGASYGGYMINWIAGNWPDRFRCLVNHDGNLCERLAYYDTEELWFPEWERGGPPWEKPEAYEKHNPINFVANWQTPMLVIHGAKDYRVVDTQGISTFTALQRRGIPSKMLYFPDENHWVLKPANSIQWHETVLDWIDQWTKA